MPSKQFLKGKQILTLYPTVKQYEQLKKKMAENGYKTLTKYLINMGLKAEVKTTINIQNAYSDELAKQQSRIIPDSTHNTVTKPTDNRQNYADSRKAKEEYKAEQKAKKPAMVQSFMKGGK